MALLQRAVAGPAATASAYANLVGGLWDLRREDEADALLAEAEARYSGSDVVAGVRVSLALARDRWAEAHESSV